MSSVLELREVSAGYGPFRAIFDVSFAVPERGVVALLGANGAGKSTIARVVTGLVPVQSGALHVRGPRHLTPQGVADRTPRRRARARGPVGVRFTHRRGEPHAEPGASEVAQGGGGRARARAYSLFPRLGERRSQDAGTLSGGEQRMLSLARVLVDPPRLLVVDELSLGLAPKIIDELYATLRRVNEAGTALLIVEQYVARAVSLAQSVVVLQHGEVVFDGPVDELGDASDRLLATHSKLESPQLESS